MSEGPHLLPADFLAFLTEEGEPDLFPREWKKGERLSRHDSTQWLKIVKYFKLKMSEAKGKGRIYYQGRKDFSNYFQANCRTTFTQKLREALKPKPGNVVGTMLLLATASAATLPTASPIPLRYRYEKEFYQDIKNGVYPPKQWSESSFRIRPGSLIPFRAYDPDPGRHPTSSKERARAPVVPSGQSRACNRYRPGNARCARRGAPRRGGARRDGEAGSPARCRGLAHARSQRL